jgi:hypothetical protein
VRESTDLSLVPRSTQVTDSNEWTVPPPPPPPQPRPLNTYALLSLLLSLMVFPPLGIYFARKAKQQIAETGESGIELANVGEIVGWVFTSLIGVMFCLWCGVVISVFSA